MWSNKSFEIQSTLINLHPNEYSKELYYYPFAVKLGRCVGSFNTLNDLSNKVCVPNKTRDLNLSVFNMVQHISCKCKCKCNSNQWWNNDKCRCEYKKHICEKDYIWNPATCSCKNGKYLASIVDDLVIMCDEIIDADAKGESYDEEAKAIPKI